MPDLPDDTRYRIHRRDGRTWCEACDQTYDSERDSAGYVLWFTAEAARLRGLTHCSQCGRPLIPTDESAASGPPPAPGDR
jgi:hypothetical protein